MPDGDVRLLVVEDNDVDAELVVRSLRKNKIANPILLARDGREALEILRGEGGRERLEQPYLILLDINMPRMNGLEFLEEIRKDPQLASSIVFVFTTSDDERDIAAAYGCNVAGYVPKSNAGRDFLNLVSMLDSFVLSVRFPTAA